VDDYEARARLTALGWTIEHYTAWPDVECIPAIAWIRPGGDFDEAGVPTDLWERDAWDPLPPIPEEVLETL
jgi:hypothetical protein